MKYSCIITALPLGGAVVKHTPERKRAGYFFIFSGAYRTIVTALLSDHQQISLIIALIYCS